MSKHIFNASISGHLQETSHAGEPHVVAPVVLLKVGVHNGSGGAVFYPETTLSLSAHGWNDVLVTKDHPMLGGAPTSARNPQVAEQVGLGRLYGVSMEQGRLKGQIYFNKRLTEQKAPGLLDKIRTNQPVEVSTGLFSEDQPTAGAWNGESYSAIVTNIKPDHLAILSDKQGACSWIDGCGVRANKSLWELNSEFQKFLKNYKEKERMDSIEPLSLPRAYYNANPGDLALVRAFLVAEYGNEEGTRKLQDMTADDVKKRAEKLIGNSCGSDDDVLPSIDIYYNLYNKLEAKK
jgi:hypothetical protein